MESGRRSNPLVRDCFAPLAKTSHTPSYQMEGISPQAKAKKGRRPSSGVRACYPGPVTEAAPRGSSTGGVSGGKAVT